MIERMLTVNIKNQVQPIHWHDLLEINFVLEGQMDVVRNNRTIHVKAGEMIVLNRDDVHSISSESENLLYVQMHLDLEWYNQYIPDIWTILFYCSPENDNVIARNLIIEIKSHISNIIKLMNELENNVDAEKKIVYYCIDILSSLKMGFDARADQGKQNLTVEQAGRFWKAIDYMYDNHSRKLTLHEVAQHIYVSDDYFSKILNKQFGKGFSKFLSFIRAEMSIKLLLNSDMSITNIAYECGFSALKYYKAAFTETYGCSPSEYRSKNRANFLMEKHNEFAGIIYDEGVDKNSALKKLDKYRLYWAESNTIKRNIELDISDINQIGKVLHKAEVLKTSNSMLSDYNIQRVISDIKYPCVKLDNNVFTWVEGDAVKIVIFNANELSKMDYLIKVIGLDANYTYVYCREKSPDIPACLQSALNEKKLMGLNRDIISNIYEMTFEYGEVSRENQFYMDIELKEKQVTKITIQKYGA